VIRLHPLVRDTSRPRPGRDPEEHATYLSLAARLLGRAAGAPETGLPEEPAMWPVWQLLVPHATHIFDYLTAEPDSADDAAETSSYALGMAARYLSEQGMRGQAEAHQRSVLRVRQKVLGPEHPDTLATRHSIARGMAARGDHTGAEAEYGMCWMPGCGCWVLTIMTR
jgi:Tetratricopeptide repeat